MVKYCEVCGKQIKSGWKYCWEHRNTRTDGYGLPLEKIRRGYYAQGNIGMLGLGIFLIIIGFFTITFGVGIIFIILGGILFWMGLKDGGDIEKKVIRDKIEAKKNRERLYESINEEVYYKKPNKIQEFNDNLGGALTSIFRGMQKR